MIIYLNHSSFLRCNKEILNTTLYIFEIKLIILVGYIEKIRADVIKTNCSQGKKIHEEYKLKKLR